MVRANFLLGAIFCVVLMLTVADSAPGQEPPGIYLDTPLGRIRISDSPSIRPGQRPPTDRPITGVPTTPRRSTTLSRSDLASVSRLSREVNLQLGGVRDEVIRARNSRISTAFNGVVNSSKALESQANAGRSVPEMQTSMASLTGHWNELAGGLAARRVTIENNRSMRSVDASMRQLSGFLRSGAAPIPGDPIPGGGHGHGDHGHDEPGFGAGRWVTLPWGRVWVPEGSGEGPLPGPIPGRIGAAEYREIQTTSTAAHESIRRLRPHVYRLGDWNLDRQLSQALIVSGELAGRANDRQSPEKLRESLVKLNESWLPVETALQQRTGVDIERDRDRVVVGKATDQLSNILHVERSHSHVVGRISVDRARATAIATQLHHVAEQIVGDVQYDAARSPGLRTLVTQADRLHIVCDEVYEALKLNEEHAHLLEHYHDFEQALANWRIALQGTGRAGEHLHVLSDRIWELDQRLHQVLVIDPLGVGSWKSTAADVDALAKSVEHLAYDLRIRGGDARCEQAAKEVAHFAEDLRLLSKSLRTSPDGRRIADEFHHANETWQKAMSDINRLGLSRHEHSWQVTNSIDARLRSIGARL